MAWPPASKSKGSPAERTTRYRSSHPVGRVPAVLRTDPGLRAVGSPNSSQWVLLFSLSLDVPPLRQRGKRLNAISILSYHRISLHSWPSILKKCPCQLSPLPHLPLTSQPTAIWRCPCTATKAAPCKVTADGAGPTRGSRVAAVTSLPVTSDCVPLVCLGLLCTLPPSPLSPLPFNVPWVLSRPILFSFSSLSWADFTHFHDRLCVQDFQLCLSSPDPPPCLLPTYTSS